MLFALFEDDVSGHFCTASCASLHMRLIKVGRLRRPVDVKTLTPKLRMSPFRGSSGIPPTRHCVTADGAARWNIYPEKRARLAIF